MTEESVAIYRRNCPGSKAKDWCRWTDEPFEEMKSSLNVRQFIQQTVRRDKSNPEAILKMPDFLEDEGVWKYEHLRQFCMELNGLAVRLQNLFKPVTEMTATELWTFLCAPYKTPKKSSAVDYTRRTLDWAASLLNSDKYFSSGVNLESVCRELYWIFSFAYIYHYSVYEAFEKETYLCKRFIYFITKYSIFKVIWILPKLDDDTRPEN